ncbi:hypothetical protein [Acidihalobacter ferrooxydans]|uniref:Uncharacterized protein n=1 Tax=Acidihalobacter ferrooxydans TaxID=1765967 RepID=A0A1P8UEQ9_9GAMM|nr:hypothetical protein [Acidihalobacter ferrooxydans]APZ42311.1 hypothetical protein BW247_03755 [Acidihalobacter ferrooxydans]
MRHEQLTRITVRSLAYARLCADGTERDASGVLTRLAETLDANPDTAMQCVLDEFGGKVSVQCASVPSIVRGSMRHD